MVETLNDGSTKLTINKCTTEDNDTYLCVAENDGGAVQIRCSLNVLGMLFIYRRRFLDLILLSSQSYYFVICFYLMNCLYELIVSNEFFIF